MSAISVREAVGRARTGFVEFWQWWTTALMNGLPSFLRQQLATLRTPYSLDITPGAWTVTDRRSKERTVLQILHAKDTSPSIDLKGRRIGSAELRLSPSLAFTRKVTFPLAAEKNLTAIVRNEIDRVTPFSSDKTYFDCPILSRDRVAGKLHVNLIVAKRDVIDEPIQIANRAGIRVRQVTLSETGNATGPHNLLCFAQQPNRSRWSHVNIGLALAAAALIAVSINKAYETLDGQIQSLTQEVAQKRTQATEAANLRKKIIAATQRDAFLETRKLAPTPLQVVNDVTHVLSDQTWLTQIQIGEWEIQLSGFSKDAATVLTELQKSDTLRKPRFRSPLTPNGDWERFDVTAETSGQTKP